MLPGRYGAPYSILAQEFRALGTLPLRPRFSQQLAGLPAAPPAPLRWKMLEWAVTIKACSRVLAWCGGTWPVPCSSGVWAWLDDVFRVLGRRRPVLGANLTPCSH